MKLVKSEVKYLRSFSRKKNREEQGKFLVEGWHGVQDALNSGRKIELLVLLPKQQYPPEYKTILSQVRERRVPMKEISEKELQLVSDTVHAQGVVALVNQKRYTLDEILSSDTDIVVLLDAISDPGNLGSILRTCSWFGVSSVVLGKGCVELHNEKVVRSTAGSVFYVQAVENVDLTEVIKHLRRSGFTILASAGNGPMEYTSTPKLPKIALILGNEANGVSHAVRSASDTIIKIPGLGAAESLNVGVACGILLAHLKDKTGKR